MAKAPAVAVVDPADVPQWQTWMKDAGWAVIAGEAGNSPDQRVQSLTAAVEKAIKDGTADPARIYLVGRGPQAAYVYYTISRVPDLWAAAVAVEGTPQAAIQSDRIFTANLGNLPILWVTAASDAEAVAQKLRDREVDITTHPLAGFTNKSLIEWLSKQERPAFPETIDCESNSPTFARCFWIQITTFDVNERNDVLPSTRLAATGGATLNLGEFNHDPNDPGPGVLVTSVAEKGGQLKAGDRIVAIDGRNIENAKALAEILARYKEDRATVLMVQRGKDRVRVETQVVMPKRDPVVTGRVQAKYLPEQKVIQIASRAVKEMKVTVPPEWAQGSTLYWNGLVLEKIDRPGCIGLRIEKEILRAASCQ